MNFDHIVFGCRDFDAGITALSVDFGPPAGRGVHAFMGTHNALWNMGDAYIELVAIDPEGVTPDRKRWFGLDDPGVQARFADGPRLLTWVVAVDDPAALAAQAPEPFGAPEDFARDDLTWAMAVPVAGMPALDGLWPGPIRWMTGLHPAERLGDQGLRCTSFALSHPQIATLAAACEGIGAPVSFAEGPVQITCTIETPSGERTYTAFDT